MINRNHDRAGSDGCAGTDSGGNDDSGYDSRTGHFDGAGDDGGNGVQLRFLSLPAKLINSCLQHYLATSNGDRGSTDIYGSPDTWTAPATSMATATM